MERTILQRLTRNRHLVRVGAQLLNTAVTCLSSSTDDEEEAEKRKAQCLNDMAFLDQQFVDLKDM